MADINGDGKPDLSHRLLEQWHSKFPLVGNGKGTFQVQDLALAAGPYPPRLAMNDDGRLHLISANWSSNTAAVLRGNGNGTFLAQNAFVSVPIRHGLCVVIADLTGDDKADRGVAYAHRQH